MNKWIYDDFLETKIWMVLERGIQDLVANEDLEEKTNRKYLIGYLAKCLSDENCLNRECLKKNHSLR